MERVAIVINSRYGQTEKIANWLRGRMAPFVGQVHVFKVVEGSDTKKIDLDHYNMVIVGAPVYAGNFSSVLTSWLRTFSATLQTKHCALFTVSGNAADARPEARATDDMLLHKFIAESWLKPQFVASFGGAIHFTKYNFLLRWMMKRISAKAGGSTDTSVDHELTDWDQVDAFVHALLDQDRNSPFATSVRFSGQPDLASNANSMHSQPVTSK